MLLLVSGVATKTGLGLSTLRKMDRKISFLTYHYLSLWVSVTIFIRKDAFVGFTAIAPLSLRTRAAW